MSTLEVDSIVAATADTDLSLDGAGTGVVNLATGAELNGTALTSTFNPYVAPSTSGNVLTSNGSAWTSAAAGGGATTLIAHATPTSVSSYDITGTDATAYSGYVIDYHLKPATDDNPIYLRFSTDGGSTFITGANYEYADWRLNSATTSGATVSTGAAHFALSQGGVSNGADFASSGRIVIYAPDEADYTYVTWQTSANQTSGPTYTIVSGAGIFKSTTEPDAFRLVFSSGNIASGQVTVRGINKA